MRIYDAVPDLELDVHQRLGLEVIEVYFRFD
jgi:hypothetical protein